MTRRSKVKRITRQRWKQPCWKTPPPTSTGAEMLPALLLCFCRIIKQGSSFVPALPGSHLGRRGAEEPVPTAWHKPKPGEAAALKTLQDFWSMLGFWSAHLVKLIVHKLGISNFWMLSILWCCESFLTKSQRIRDKHIIPLFVCSEPSHGLFQQRAGEGLQQEWVPWVTWGSAVQPRVFSFGPYPNLNWEGK